MLYSLRVDTSTSGSPVHLPFDLSENTTIVVRRVDCSISGVGFESCERVELHLFGQQTGAITSNIDSTDVIIPTFGQNVTRMDHGFILDLHHVNSRRCTPSLTLFQANGAAPPATVTATVFVLLDIHQVDKTQGISAAANMRQINVPLSTRMARVDGNEGLLQTVQRIPRMQTY